MITGLNADTSYEVRVRAVCNNELSEPNGWYLHLWKYQKYYALRLGWKNGQESRWNFGNRNALDISDLSKGIYLMEIITGKQLPMTKKLITQ